MPGARLCKPFPEFGKGPSPVAGNILYIGEKLRRRAAELRIFKDRVISETPFSSRFEYDPSGPSAFEGLIRPINPEKDENASECGGPVFGNNLLELIEKLPDIYFVRRVSSGVPGGVDTRRTAQGLYLETRVIGKHRLPCELRNRSCLDQGVLKKALPVLLDVRDVRKVLQGKDLRVTILEHRFEFVDFALIF